MPVKSNADDNSSKTMEMIVELKHKLQSSEQMHEILAVVNKLQEQEKTTGNIRFGSEGTRFSMPSAMSLCVVHNRLDVIQYFMNANRGLSLNDCNEAFIIATMLKKYNFIQFFLQVGMNPFLAVDLDRIQEVIPEIKQCLQEILDMCYSNPIHGGNSEQSTELSVWIIALIRDDLLLYKHLEEHSNHVRDLTKELASSNGVQHILSSSIVSVYIKTELYPFYTACIYKAYNILKYLLGNKKGQITKEFKGSDKSSKAKSNHRRNLVLLVSIAYKDTRLLSILFKYDFLNLNLEKQFFECTDGRMLPVEHGLQPGVSSLLHHVITSGCCAFLTPKISTVNQQQLIGGGGIDATTPSVVEFLINQGVDKESLVYSEQHALFLRPMTMLCSQMVDWLHSNNDMKKDNLAKAITYKQHLSTVLKSMELLKFPPNALRVMEMNPLAYTIKETATMLQSVDQYLNMYPNHDIMVQRLQESLKISKAIIQWLLIQGFKYAPINGNFGISNTEEETILTVILCFMNQYELFISSCSPNENIGRYYCKMLYLEYFKDILRLFHQYGCRIELNKSFTKLIYHNSILDFDPTHSILELVLSQLNQSQRKATIKILLRYGCERANFLNESGIDTIRHLQYFERNPLKLVDISRSVIFESMATPIVNKVQDLMIPETLRHYLLYLE